MRQVVESIDVAVVLYSLDPARFLYVSPRYQEIFGHNPLSDGTSPAEVIHNVVAEDRARFRSDYWEPAQAGLFGRCEYRMTRAGGDIRWIRSTSTPVVDEDGVVRRCAAVAEDITDMKRTEAALSSAEEARRANAAKNEFLSRMSHELRTPLNAVLGFAQLLEIDDLTDDQHTSVDHILSGGHHLVGLIDDVLDIAKIEGDRLDLSLESLLMSELLTDTVALMMPMATSADVRLSFDKNDGANQHVHGDSRRLRQVVLNLLSNAIKYNRPGGSVAVRCEVSAHGVNIVVQDTGIGIPAEELPRLFTPFDRLGAQTTNIEGSGVGLALSHRLMTTMNGTLSATSELGVGSVFTASVPLATPEDLAPTLPAPPLATETEGPTKPEPSAPAANLTLLYVEDNSSNTTLMAHLISHRPQWHMTTAGTGHIGLDYATTQPPDLVLLDLHLPDMDGIEVLHRLRSDPRTSDLRVVVVSADASPNQINRLLAAGAYAYLTKPLDVSEMLRVLDACAHSAEAPL